MLSIPRYVTINIENLTRPAKGQDIKILIDSTEVDAILFGNGSVSWLNPKSCKTEIFRNISEAKTEIELIVAGLRRTVRLLEYKGYRTEALGSVLFQQPDHVQDWFKNSDGAGLIGQLDYVYSFCFYPSVGAGEWHSFTSYEEARKAFIVAVDYDLSPSEIM